MIESIEQRTRRARLGALLFGLALLGAVMLIVVRLGRDGDRDQPVPLPTDVAAPSAVATTTPILTPAIATTPIPTPALAADGAPSADGRRVVCLDPGHGGIDLGHVRLVDGEIALQEKDLTLEHALLLADRLRAEGIEVALTRSADVDINMHNLDVNGDGTVAAPDNPARSDETDDLQSRINICNRAGADLVVSMHYNGAENQDLEGYEVWYNDQRPFQARNLHFASLIHDQLGRQMEAAGYPAVDRGIDSADFAILAPARPGKLDPSQMPGALVEGLFLSNDEDAAFLESDAATEALVTAYQLAIVGYFEEYPG